MIFATTTKNCPKRCFTWADAKSITKDVRHTRLVGSIDPRVRESVDGCFLPLGFYMAEFFNA